MLPVIEELMEEMTPSDLENLLSWHSHKSTLQRLGYLLEELQADSQLIEQLFEYFKSIKYHPILLSPKSKQKPGAVDNRWSKA
ncbi:hypothetical protein MNBD_BACTEROID03-424 [hydrothermal vent metagenome]|uniref:Uncharacterized protein n=1 Tax=hydrothermal vent metagenome TaxID=652676 RepID=A0A3B0TEM4_9ZZZZ